MMKTLTPKQINELQVRVKNAEKHLEDAQAERDVLRDFLTDLRDNSELDDAMKKRIQTVLNKSFR